MILPACSRRSALALGAGYLRAAARRFEPPLTPSALAAVCACVTALLVAFRLIQEPGFDAATTVEAGAPLALVGARGDRPLRALALRAEEAGTAWRAPAAEEAERRPASGGRRTGAAGPRP